MNDDEFDQLVVAECKDPESVDSGVLYEDLDHWKESLERLIVIVNEQEEIKRADLAEVEANTYLLDDEEEWLKAKAKFSTWTAKAHKYKRHLEERLVSVKELLRERDGVDEAIEVALSRVLTEVGRMCKLGEGTAELQRAYLLLEVANEMKESGSE